MTKIVAISNHKGGVGKTTTCFNLGAALVGSGLNVLLIDMDPQANLTLAAGMDPEDLDLTIVDLYRKQDPVLITKLIHDTSYPGLYIIPADLRLAQVEKEFYDLEDYESILLHEVGSLQDQYDYVLIDCPPTIGGLTLVSLTTANVVLVPVQCEYYAARGLNVLVQVIETVKERTNPGLEWYLLTSLFDSRNNVHKQVYNQLVQSFPEQLLATVIRMDTRLRECPLVGEPVIKYAPKTRASEQFRELARELHERLSIKNNVQ